MVTSVKEFSGHTYSSLRAIYMSRLVRNAKMKLNVETVTPSQVRMMMQKVSKGVSSKPSECFLKLELSTLRWRNTHNLFTDLVPREKLQPWWKFIDRQLLIILKRKCSCLE